MRSSSTARPVRRQRPAEQRRQPHAAIARVGRHLQEAAQRRRQPRRLFELGQELVQAIDRDGVARVHGQRALERVGRALRILGGPGQQIAQRDQVSDARVALALDGGQPAQRRRGVRPVALAHEAPRQPGQRGQIVGRRQQRVPVRVDGLADVGQRALRDVADARPRRAHHPSDRTTR